MKRSAASVGNTSTVHNLGNMAYVLALVLLSGPWTERALEARAIDALGTRSAKRARRLVEEVLTACPTPYAPRLALLTDLIRATKAIKRIGGAAAERLMNLSVVTRPPRFEPIAALRGLDIPPIKTQGELAGWLDIPLHHLAWMTDERRTLRHALADGPLAHYDAIWTPKKDDRWRLIEAPKARMKQIQRRILHEILDRLPPHEAATAFVKGRDIAHAAATHAGEEVVMTVDLEDFFLHVQQRRIHAVFRCLGYSFSVARMLTSLCTTTTTLETIARHPGKLHHDRTAWDAYRTQHLPQGAPTSPALANLTSRRLDERLSGLARRFDARYTRYADDLTFSGDAALANRSTLFLDIVATIVKDEGFALNRRKTRIMRRSTRQTVTGLVVNDHINVARPDYDALKATLTNCLRHGAAAQNRDGHADFRAHLDGRVAWVEHVNLRRGEKLRRLFEAISW